MKRYRVLVTGVAFLAMAVAATRANAASTGAVATNAGSWGTASTWAPAVVPSGDYYVQWNATNNVKVDYDDAVNRVVCRFLMASTAAGSELYFAPGAGQLSVSGGTSNIFCGLAINNNTQGKLTMDGGTFTVPTAATWFGLNTAFSGGSWAFAGATGSTATATINTTATLSALGGGIGVGGGAGSTALLDVNGGTVNATTIQWNTAGTNTVNVKNSGTLSTGGFSFRGAAGGLYYVNLDGGKLVARANNASFLTGVTSATIDGGGATIDSGVYNITVGQSLLGGTGTGGLTKLGTGALTLTGTNTYTGNTTVSNGLLAITSTSALPGWDATGRYSVAAGAGLSVGQTIADADVTTMLGTGNFSAGSAIGYDVTTTRSVDVSTVPTGMALAKTGAGALTVTGTAAYTAGTIVNAGILVVPDLVSLPGWNTAGKYSVGAGAAVNIGDSVTDADIAAMYGTGNFAAGSAIGYHVTGTRSVNASTVPTTRSLPKSGTGTLNVTGKGYYTGNTTVIDGTLALGNGLALQKSTLDMIGGAVDFGALTTATVGGLQGTANLALPSGLTLTVGKNNSTTTYSGSLSGNGGLKKVGTGALTLSGVNSYSGATTAAGGTLSFKGQAVGVTQTLGALTTAAGSGYTLVQSVYGTSGNTNLTFSGGYTRSVGSVLDLWTSGGANGTTNKIVLGGQATGIINDPGVFFGTVSAAWYDAGGFVRGVNYGVDPGSVAVTSGSGSIAGTTVLRISGAAAVGPTAQESAIFGSLWLSGAPTFTLAPGALVTTNTIVKSGNQYSAIAVAGGTDDTSALQAGYDSEMVIVVRTSDNLAIVPRIVDNGTNALTKIGLGPLYLYGDNGYTGPTTIAEGMLALGIGGRSGISYSSEINVLAGATFNVASVETPGGYVLGSSQTLKGNGTVVGGVLANGDVAPGASIGTLTFNGALTLAGEAIMEISKDGSLLTSDLINVTGTNALAYGGTLTVTELDSVAYAMGDTWNLFDAGSFSGSFGTINLPTLGAGWSWDITNLSVDGTVSVVPEPSTLALLATGLFGLIAYAWRKRK